MKEFGTAAANSDHEAERQMDACSAFGIGQSELVISIVTIMQYLLCNRDVNCLVITEHGGRIAV
jgi:hypothetical protein